MGPCPSSACAAHCQAVLTALSAPQLESCLNRQQGTGRVPAALPPLPHHTALCWWHDLNATSNAKCVARVGAWNSSAPLLSTQRFQLLVLCPPLAYRLQEPGPHRGATVSQRLAERRAATGGAQ